MATESISHCTAPRCIVRRLPRFLAFLVVVHRVNTYVGNRVYPAEFGRLLYLNLSARPDEVGSDFDIAPPIPKPVVAIELTDGELKKFEGKYKRDGMRENVVIAFTITAEGSSLRVKPEEDTPFTLIPVAPNRFQMEGSSGTYVEFVMTDEGVERGKLTSDVEEPFDLIPLRTKNFLMNSIP